MPRVFTIYNCGTAFNRNNRTELIADLAARTEGDEGDDWMINAGPGSSPNSNLEYFGPQRDNPITGSDGTVRYQYGMNSLSPQMRPGTFNPETGRKKSWINRTSGIRGSLTGKGWEDNVKVAMYQLDSLGNSGELPEVVNMAGWSRGGVTCHMVANAMYKEYGETIKVNIFAVDPVPGFGQWKKLRTTIKSNVKNYAAIIQENDTRFTFKAVQMKPNGTTDVKLHSMPGNHSTVVSGNKQWEGGSIDMAILGQHLTESFLAEHGTGLRNLLNLSNVQVCEHYAKVRENLPTYHSMGRNAMGLFYKFKRKMVSRGSQETPFYVNEHHEECFQKEFQQVHYALNVNNFVAHGQWRMVGMQLAFIQRCAPITYRVLENTRPEFFFNLEMANMREITGSRRRR